MHTIVLECVDRMLQFCFSPLHRQAPLKSVKRQKERFAKGGRTTHLTNVLFVAALRHFSEAVAMHQRQRPLLFNSLLELCNIPQSLVDAPVEAQERDGAVRQVHHKVVHQPTSSLRWRLGWTWSWSCSSCCVRRRGFGLSIGPAWLLGGFRCEWCERSLPRLPHSQTDKIFAVHVERPTPVLHLSKDRVNP